MEGISSGNTMESQSKQEMIERAESFDQLFETLNTIGSIQGSKREYSAAELITLINEMRKERLQNGPASGKITSSEGLKEKVQDLLFEEMSGKKA